jgi:hypothetical protein
MDWRYKKVTAVFDVEQDHITESREDLVWSSEKVMAELHGLSRVFAESANAQ